MTNSRTKVKVCPRCSVQVKGWVFYENGLGHCLMCGFVISDEGYRGVPSFKELFARYANRQESKQFLFAKPDEDSCSGLLGLEEPVELKPGVDDENF